MHGAVIEVVVGRDLAQRRAGHRLRLVSPTKPST